jgi:polyisoprenoid-binding protein YceI
MSKLSDLKAGTWNADASHSEVGFTARRALVSKIRGQFKDFAAVVTIGRPFEQSTVEATVQMASVDTSGADRDTDLKRGADRDTDLKSADFLDVKNHPTMTFKSTKVTDNSLEGDLTIRGITKPVTFDLDFVGISDDPLGGTRAGFEATTEIDSKDFDLTWTLGVEGARVPLGEKVKIAMDLELIQA